MARPHAVGIDLGTTISAVAWRDRSGHTAMIPNSEGDVLTPSVVLFEDDEVIVGKEAKKSAVVRLGRVAETVKRDMGNPTYSRAICGKQLPPEVIQAYILRKLKDDAERVIGPEFRVVITVPAFFDEPRRRATAQAAELAGLHLLDIVNEPTAAALAFGEELGYLTDAGRARDTQTVLVYDLGGGTFDVTVVRLTPGHVRTLATDGDVQLGGHDWDLRLVDFAAERFTEVHRDDPRKHPASLQRLLQSAEEAKHTLSARQQATIHVEHAGLTKAVRVTREEFETVTADLLDRTTFTTRQVLSAANITWNDIDRVILVGGATRMPMVRHMLEQLSGKAPDHTVHPDEAVARGAAIYAHYLQCSDDPTAAGQNLTITNVNAHSLGIEGINPDTLAKCNKILIKRNTPLPARITKEFKTKKAGQISIVVQALEGESALPSECAAIGRTVIRDLPRSLAKGSPIDVTFEYAVNGRLSIKAVVRETGREAKLDLERNAVLTDERASRWRRVLAEGGSMSRIECEPELTIDYIRSETLVPELDDAAADLPPVDLPPSAPVAPMPPAETPAPKTPAYHTPAPTPSPDYYQQPAPTSATYSSTGPMLQVAALAPARSPVAPLDPLPAAPAETLPSTTGMALRRRRSKLFKIVFYAVLHITASVTGLSVGYYMLCRLQPERYNMRDLPAPAVVHEWLQRMELEEPADTKPKSKLP
jgi:molecular chaperone DnaK